jgi:AcrR family transcriptional regulator
MTENPRVRARPLTPERRREALVDATLRLLREHGRQVTTRQIAEEARVAEGTIFRVFATKEELIDTAIARGFRPGDLVARIQEIDPDLPLRERLLRLVSILQQRFRATVGLMHKVGLVGPPDHLHDSAEADALRSRLEAWMVAVVGTDRDRLRVPPEEFVHVLRLLTFAGSHQKIADGRLLTPDQIVDTVLHGHLREN